MSLILNIDTATEKAHVSFSKNGSVLHSLNNESQKDHASFLQSAILDLTGITGLQLTEVDGVAVTAGPGSYTGLRVGMASAKGLCYALQKPLICMNTLEVLTVSAKLLLPVGNEHDLFCPMIDARRMEVFTAVYKEDLSIYLSPRAIILDESFMKTDLQKTKIFFFGSGSKKWSFVCNHTNAIFFENLFIQAEAMAKYSDNLYNQRRFTELAYSEPIYLKEFQTVIK